MRYIVNFCSIPVHSVNLSIFDWELNIFWSGTKWNGTTIFWKSHCILFNQTRFGPNPISNAWSADIWSTHIWPTQCLAYTVATLIILAQSRSIITFLYSMSTKCLSGKCFSTKIRGLEVFYSPSRPGTKPALGHRRKCSWPKCCKTFYGRNLQLFRMTFSVCPWQALTASSNVCG